MFHVTNFLNNTYIIQHIRSGFFHSYSVNKNRSPKKYATVLCFQHQIKPTFVDKLQQTAPLLTFDLFCRPATALIPLPLPCPLSPPFFPCHPNSFHQSSVNSYEVVPRIANSHNHAPLCPQTAHVCVGVFHLEHILGMSRKQMANKKVKLMGFI